MAVFENMFWRYAVWHSSSEEGSDLSEDIKLEALELLETLTIWYSERGGKPPVQGDLSSEDVNEVFRPLHSLKGLCQMGGLKSLEKLVHIVEDRVAAAREGTEFFSQEVFDILGDLLKIFEQFFRVFPNPVSPRLEKDIQDLTSTAHMLKSGERRKRPQKNEPHLSQGAQAPTECSSASGGDDVELTPTQAENTRFREFCARSENLLAAVYQGNKYPDRSSLQASEGYENLTRVVEIIYERTFPPHGTLIVFASDLDAEMASSLGAVDAFAIDRIDFALANLDPPWSLVAFDSATSSAESYSAAVDDSASKETAEVGSSNARPSKIAQKLEKHSGGAAAGAHSSAGSAILPYEDFDSTNQSSNAAAMELDKEMLDDFLVNADELLEQLTQSMLELESDPGNSESVESIFRAAHTIKGTAGMFGFRAIEKLTHVMENTFDRIRKGELAASPALMDGLLAALDRVRGCFESLKEGNTAELEINNELNKVLQADFAASHGIEIAPSSKAAPAASASSNSDHLTTARPQIAAAAASVTAKAVSEPGRDRAAASSGSASEASSSSSSSAGGSGHSDDGSGGGKKGKPKDGAALKKNSEVGTIRVDLGRLDALVNLVGELVIDRTRFARIEETLRASGQNSELLHTMSETLLLFGRHMNDVQSIIMKIRMVPVGNAFYKFTRVVRDLARTCGKEIDLVIEGGETELDKTLVEEIGDPLVHLIRNSADHGIETPDVRLAAGKNPRGTITLRAYQDGNMIVIFISDDGKGLAVDRIRQKAITQGLISETDQLHEKDIFNLIFEPGFSTAEKVTNISGRGVGMDAVKKSITKLKGIIELDSMVGAGTQITIKLPLTLAIIPSLLVESHRETYAIPLVNVIESIRIGPEEVQRIGHSDFVKLRERVVPLLKLADVFDLKSLPDRIWYSVGQSESNNTMVLDIEGEGSQNEKRRAAATTTLPRGGLSAKSKARSKRPRLIFVVVGVGEQRVGFIVDQLMGQQEIVIKSLGRILGRTRGVSGGCVLGNGRVALVLDVGELIEDHSESGKGGAHRAAV